MAEMKWGDWIEIDGVVYIISIVMWIDKHPLYDLISLVDGNRFDEPVWYKKQTAGTKEVLEPLPIDLLYQLIGSNKTIKILDKSKWLRLIRT